MVFPCLHLQAKDFRENSSEDDNQKSHRWITSKLLSVLETGVILVIALYKDIAEGQFSY
jgi:hypothetical protein